jgi:hypothetical protein
VNNAPFDPTRFMQASNTRFALVLALFAVRDSAQFAVVRPSIVAAPKPVSRHTQLVILCQINTVLHPNNLCPAHVLSVPRLECQLFNQWFYLYCFCCL